MNIRRSTTRIGLPSSVTNPKFYQPGKGPRARRAPDGSRRADRCVTGHAGRREADSFPIMSEAFDRLDALVERLRRDCPWDREQSFDTLRTYLVEETYEVLAALE